MASYDIFVDFDEMNNRISKLEKSISNMESYLTTLRKDTDELNKSWEGKNHDDFEKKFNVRYENTSTINKDLKVKIAALKKTKEQYEKVIGDIDSFI